MPFVKNVFHYMGNSVAKIKGNSPTIARLIFMPASVTPSDRQVFDYTILDAPTSQFVQQQTGEIRALMKLSFESIVQIGQKLKTVKEQLGHGHFRAWLNAEFNWGAWTATKFMQVAERFEGTNFSHLDIAPSALYDLAAPSTPQAAREEVLDRAASGESITYTTAKAIKQKYAPSQPKPKRELSSKPKLELEPVLQLPSPIPTVVSQPRSKLEIVAIRPPAQAPVSSPATTTPVPQTGLTLRSPQPPDAPDLPGIWWQLGGKHLLYCGDPNSPEFLERIPEQVNLLLAFPPTPAWQSQVRAKSIISLTAPSSPQGNNLTMFEDMVELMLLLYSGVRDTVVHSFLPLIESFWVIDRLNRRSLIAEPDFKRCNEVVADWKKAGLKVERIN